MISAQPRFIQGVQGRLFLMEYAPQSDVVPRGYLIFVPPFAEEMNRSRRMMTLQARRLSQLGYGVLIIDLYGTGDSEGDFADVRWKIWRQDLGLLVESLQKRGITAVSLLGLRLGALLALDYAGSADSQFEKLLLWQPALNGKAIITQFLRLRVAAGMLSRGAKQESTQSLRELLSQGVSVEVAGYELAPELVSEIDAIRIESLVNDNSSPIYWLELVPEAGQSLSPASALVVNSWLKRSIKVEATAITGDPFWSLQETTLSPMLMDATDRLFHAKT